MGNYEREMAAVQVPHLGESVPISSDGHFSSLKAGEITASHTQYTGEGLTGYATVQNSAIAGATLMRAALEQIGAVAPDVDAQAVNKAMRHIIEAAGIPFAFSGDNEVEHAA